MRHFKCTYRHSRSEVIHAVKKMRPLRHVTSGDINDMLDIAVNRPDFGGCRYHSMHWDCHGSYPWRPSPGTMINAEAFVRRANRAIGSDACMICPNGLIFVPVKKTYYKIDAVLSLLIAHFGIQCPVCGRIHDPSWRGPCHYILHQSGENHLCSRCKKRFNRFRDWGKPEEEQFLLWLAKLPSSNYFRQIRKEQQVS